MAVIGAIVAGNFQGAVRDLCHLVGRTDVPEVVNRRRGRHSIAQSHGAAVQRARREQPKPQGRIISEAAQHEYALRHPACELVNCRRPPAPQPHHLISRKMHGDDVPGNLVRLCRFHHDEWHRAGGKRWLQKYGPTMTAELRSKVETALRLMPDEDDAVQEHAAN